MRNFWEIIEIISSNSESENSLRLTSLNGLILLARIVDLTIDTGIGCAASVMLNLFHVILMINIAVHCSLNRTTAKVPKKNDKKFFYENKILFFE